MIVCVELSRMSNCIVFHLDASKVMLVSTSL